MKTIIKIEIEHKKPLPLLTDMLAARIYGECVNKTAQMVEVTVKVGDVTALPVWRYEDL